MFFFLLLSFGSPTCLAFGPLLLPLQTQGLALKPQFLQAVYSGVNAACLIWAGSAVRRENDLIIAFWASRPVAPADVAFLAAVGVWAALGALDYLTTGLLKGHTVGRRSAEKAYSVIVQVVTLNS